MSKIFLVRHGQTESNKTGFYMGWSDEDLNKAGLSQVEALAERLAGQSISAVYSSPLRRALTTAATIGKPHNLEPRIVDDLIEIKLGEWQGLHMDVIAQRWAELWGKWRTDPSSLALPGGESFMQVVERNVRAFWQIANDAQDKNVLLVSHEIVVKILVSYVLGTDYSIYRRFEISNASMSAVRTFDTKMRLITLNDTSHIKD